MNTTKDAVILRIKDYAEKLGVVPPDPSHLTWNDLRKLENYLWGSCLARGFLKNK